jgi:CheY-like chemotaxis protein
MSVRGVLIVEDDEGIRETLAELFLDAGYAVLLAPNGQVALDYLRQETAGWVVLVDLMMPVMDGYAFLQVVATDRLLATQHAYILMSATIKTVPLAVADLLRRLHLSSLSKPFDLEEALGAVEKAAHRLPQDAS